MNRDEHSHHSGAPRAPGHKGAQMASLIQRIVQMEILRGIADPRMRGLVTVLGVDMAADTRLGAPGGVWVAEHSGAQSRRFAFTADGAQRVTYSARAEIALCA